MTRYLTEFRYAFFISALCFIWLMLEYVAGFHDKYVQYHTFISVLSIVIPLVFYFLAIIKKRDDELDGIISFRQAVLSGLTITIIWIVLTVPTQLVFHYMINPRFFDVMIEEYVYHAVDKGMSEELANESAAALFNIKAYLIQRLITVLIVGVSLSIIDAWFLKRTVKPEELIAESPLDDTEQLDEPLTKDSTVIKK